MEEKEFAPTDFKLKNMEGKEIETKISPELIKEHISVIHDITGPSNVLCKDGFLVVNSWDVDIDKEDFQASQARTIFQHLIRIDETEINSED